MNISNIVLTDEQRAAGWRVEEARSLEHNNDYRRSIRRSESGHTGGAIGIGGRSKQRGQSSRRAGGYHSTSGRWKPRCFNPWRKRPRSSLSDPNPGRACVLPYRALAIVAFDGHNVAFTNRPSLSVIARTCFQGGETGSPFPSATNSFS